MHALSLIANAYGSLIIALHPWPALGATHACRSILAELARRLLELAGWLAGRVEGRRLRRFRGHGGQRCGVDAAAALHQ